jgi:hypothetical protein
VSVTAPDGHNHPFRAAPKRCRRGARLTATAVVIAALLAGTAWGDDEHFPFGPFRMYSIRNDPNGTVMDVRLRGTTSRGEEISLRAGTFGLRPAEVDGLLNRFADNSKLAAYLAEAYENLNRRPRLERLRIIRGFYRLNESRPVRYYEKTFGVWSRSR